MGCGFTGLLLYSKMSKVKTGKSSADIRKVRVNFCLHSQVGYFVSLYHRNHIINANSGILFFVLREIYFSEIFVGVGR